MIERRTCSPWLATLLTAAVCLSVWQMIGCPGPPSPVFVTSPAAYTLLSASNATTDAPYAIDSLPSTDYNTLINLTDFKFTMMNLVCNDTYSPFLLVLVHSAPGNVAKRKTIRETWGEPRDSMKLLFLFGGVDEPETQTQLEKENTQHGDLVQGNFRDAYRNMTYKHVMALKYAVYHCPQAKYILKTDDDVFVNMPTVLPFLNAELSPFGARGLLLCKPLLMSYVKRSYRSKWRVSFKEYPHKNYPPYCPGWAILYSPDVVFKLYREAQREQYFWIDDVLITGVLAKRARIEHTPISELVLSDGQLQRIIASNGSYQPAMFLYGPPDMDQHTIYSLWAIVRDRLKHYHIVSK